MLSSPVLDQYCPLSELSRVCQDTLKKRNFHSRQYIEEEKRNHAGSFLIMKYQNSAIFVKLCSEFYLPKGVFFREFDLKMCYNAKQRRLATYYII